MPSGEASDPARIVAALSHRESPSSSEEPPPCAVIVADPNADTAAQARSLTEQGFQVTVLASAADALAALSRLAPDILIVDSRLTDMTGVELVGRFRANSAWKNLPMVMVTNSREPQQVVEALICGVSDYITKPFRPEVMAARVRRVYEACRKQQARRPSCP